MQQEVEALWLALGQGEKAGWYGSQEAVAGNSRSEGEEEGENPGHPKQQQEGNEEHGGRDRQLSSSFLEAFDDDDDDDNE